MHHIKFHPLYDKVQMNMQIEYVNVYPLLSSVELFYWKGFFLYLADLHLVALWVKDRDEGKTSDRTLSNERG